MQHQWRWGGGYSSQRVLAIMVIVLAHSTVSTSVNDASTHSWQDVLRVVSSLDMEVSSNDVGQGQLLDLLDLDRREKGPDAWCSWGEVAFGLAIQVKARRILYVDDHGGKGDLSLELDRLSEWQWRTGRKFNRYFVGSRGVLGEGVDDLKSKWAHEFSVMLGRDTGEEGGVEKNFDLVLISDEDSSRLLQILATLSTCCITPRTVVLASHGSSLGAEEQLRLQDASFEFLEVPGCSARTFTLLGLRSTATRFARASDWPLLLSVGSFHIVTARCELVPIANGSVVPHCADPAQDQHPSIRIRMRAEHFNPTTGCAQTVLDAEFMIDWVAENLPIHGGLGIEDTCFVRLLVDNVQIAESTVDETDVIRHAGREWAQVIEGRWRIGRHTLSPGSRTVAVEYSCAGDPTPVARSESRLVFRPQAGTVTLCHPAGSIGHWDAQQFGVSEVRVSDADLGALGGSNDVHVMSVHGNAVEIESLLDIGAALELVGMPPHVRAQAVICFVALGGVQLDIVGRFYLGHDLLRVLWPSGQTPPRPGMYTVEVTVVDGAGEQVALARGRLLLIGLEERSRDRHWLVMHHVIGYRRHACRVCVSLVHRHSSAACAACLSDAPSPQQRVDTDSMASDSAQGPTGQVPRFHEMPLWQLIALKSLEGAAGADCSALTVASLLRRRRGVHVLELFHRWGEETVALLAGTTSHQVVSVGGRRSLFDPPQAANARWRFVQSEASGFVRRLAGGESWDAFGEDADPTTRNQTLDLVWVGLDHARNLSTLLKDLLPLLDRESLVVVQGGSPRMFSGKSIPPDESFPQFQPAGRVPDPELAALDLHEWQMLSVPGCQGLTLLRRSAVALSMDSEGRQPAALDDGRPDTHRREQATICERDVSEASFSAEGASVQNTQRRSRFVYLVHSRACEEVADLLPAGATILHAITGWSVSARCAQTLHMPGSGLVAVRNRLYELAISSISDLTSAYLVLVDADCHLHHAEGSNHLAWSQWEHALDRIRPAVATPVCDQEPPAEERWLDTRGDCVSSGMTAGTFAWAQSIMAVHIDAARLLLPYWEFPEKDSDSRSQLVLASVAAAAFRDGVVLLCAFNSHCPDANPPALTRHELKESLLWIVGSFRRVEDFIASPLHLLGSNKPNLDDFKASSAFDGQKNTSWTPVSNHHGVFDGCHPYFCSLPRGSVTLDASAYPSCADPSCAGHQDPHYQRERERLLLYLQEVFYGIESLTAMADGGPRSGDCNGVLFPHVDLRHHLAGASEIDVSWGDDVEIQMSHPQQSMAIPQDVIRGAKAAVLGVDKWRAGRAKSPHAVDASEQITQSRGADGHKHVLGVTVEMSGVETSGVLASIPRLGGVGWPPVEWYCAPADAKTVQSVQMDIVGMELHNNYRINISVWNGCRIPQDVWGKAGLDSKPECDGAELVAYQSARFSIIRKESGGFGVEGRRRALDELEEAGQEVDRRQTPEPRWTDQEGSIGAEQDDRRLAGGEQGARTPQDRVRRQEIEFVYLVQHDSCMDLSHLESERSAALLLCWKTPPGEACPHAIYFPNSTLVAGRNKLIAEGRERFRGAPVRYWIMMDGDCQLVEVADFGYNTGDAWETFEAYLREWEPAVGFPHFGPLDYDPAKEVQLAFNFDQILVAYHAETLPLLLPYSEVFDNVSWWYCASLQNVLCTVVYNDHRIQFNALRALSWVNSKASSYKRAQNFLEPLRYSWIATAVISLEALMTVPWFNGHQSAMASRWHGGSDEEEDEEEEEGGTVRRRGMWVSAGTPQRKGAVMYDAAASWIHTLDFCHPYFEGRELRQLCNSAGAGVRSERADRAEDFQAPFVFRSQDDGHVKHALKLVDEMIEELSGRMGDSRRDDAAVGSEAHGGRGSSFNVVEALRVGGLLRAEAEGELGRLRKLRMVLARRLTAP